MADVTPAICCCVVCQDDIQSGQPSRTGVDKQRRCIPCADEWDAAREADYLQYMSTVSA